MRILVTGWLFILSRLMTAIHHWLIVMLWEYNLLMEELCRLLIHKGYFEVWRVSLWIVETRLLHQSPPPPPVLNYGTWYIWSLMVRLEFFESNVVMRGRGWVPLGPSRYARCLRRATSHPVFSFSLWATFYGKYVAVFRSFFIRFVSKLFICGDTYWIWRSLYE